MKSISKREINVKGQNQERFDRHRHLPEPFPDLSLFGALKVVNKSRIEYGRVQNRRKCLRRPPGESCHHYRCVVCFSISFGSSCAVDPGSLLGGSSGIGLATVKFFSNQGAQIVCADLNPPPEDIANVAFRKVDLTKWDEQYDLFEWTKTTYGRIDIAFLNAGVAEIEDVFLDKFDDNGRLQEPKYTVLAVNLMAPINGVKLATHYMKKQPEGGSIVVTGSGKSTHSSPDVNVCVFSQRASANPGRVGFNGVGGTPMYTVAKHGVSTSGQPSPGHLSARVWVNH